MRWAVTMGAVALLAAAGCSAGASGGPQSSAGRSPAGSPATVTSTSSRPAPTNSSSSPSSSSSPPSPSSTASPSHRSASGRILGHRRLVAYYGAAGNSQLGVLGASSPEAAAAKIIRRARGYAGFGRAVQPAMELIATVAQGGPGPDGSYSKYVGDDTVRRYLSVAHEHHMALVLDLQPGRASFLRQAEALRPFLLDPSVHLGLDPEWKVGPHGRPGNGLIGSSSAAGINAVTHWLSGLVRDHDLPDKLVIVHEFTSSMLPDRENITQHPGVEMVLHADGFGTVASKINVLQKLNFPDPPFGTGFKLFLTQDQRLMSPAEVMALRPRPDVITYQ